MRIGLLHPGSMGVSVGASAVASGHEVLWASSGRSADTAARAEKHGLRDVGGLGQLVDESEIILSICPPDSASDVAKSVKDAGFAGTYVDCNAISPMRMTEIAGLLGANGGRVVDGGIIGPPAWVAGKTYLYLAGAGADDVASCFTEGPLAVTVMAGREIGDASALKMCYAAYTKGTTAILCALMSAAEALGVRDDVVAHWDIDQAGRGAERETAVSEVTQKAWRWTGEMREIAATFDGVDVPAGFYDAAAKLYERLDQFKDGPHPTPISDVLDAVRRSGSS